MSQSDCVSTSCSKALKNQPLPAARVTPETFQLWDVRAGGATGAAASAGVTLTTEAETHKSTKEI